MTQINKTVLMSGAQFFDAVGNNSYSSADIEPNKHQAVSEHHTLQSMLEQAGIEVVSVTPPANCVDGVYTANWGLCRGDKVIVSTLPPTRTEEMPYARFVLGELLGKTIIEPPADLHFSGQGDALPCGDLLFAGTGYRTDAQMHQFIAQELGYKVVSLQTVPELDTAGNPVINSATGWPDSYFYDLDLALAILRPDLIAWCPEAFTPESQDKIRALDTLEKIEVTLQEAKEGFACNLISTGETVIMSEHAPQLRSSIEARGLKVRTPHITELVKGGGYIRCTSLTLDNQ